MARPHRQAFRPCDPMRPFLVLLACLGLGAVLPVPGVSAAVEIVVPRDHTLVREDTLLILGTAPQGSTIPWSVTTRSGRVEETVRADWGDLFEIFVILEPGINRFRVGDRVFRVLYDDGAQEVPEGYRPLKVHADDVSRCADCHERAGGGLARGGYPGVCLSCHIVVSANPANRADPLKAPHFRAAVARCGRCHEPHAGTDPKLLTAGRVDLCTACHTDRRPGEGAHPALDEGGCTACHDPHYSGYPADLLRPLPGLCAGCHDQGEGSLRRLHAPVGSGRSCATCHDSHGETAGLLRAALPGLCTGCHGDVLRAGHGEALAACAGCHDPHGPAGSGLLSGPVNGACRDCHPEVGRGRTVHPALDLGCQACHDPHRDGGGRPGAEPCAGCHDTDRSPELASLHGNLRIPGRTCALCHPPHDAPGRSLVRGTLHDPLARGRCTVCHGGGADRSINVDNPAQRCRMCHTFEKDLAVRGARTHAPVDRGQCTVCHDPHMSPRRWLLRAGGDELCRGCHDTAGHAHPLGPSGEGEPPEGARILTGEGGDIPCLGCHAAHGSGEPGPLIRPGRALCRTCHGP